MPESPSQSTPIGVASILLCSALAGLLVYRAVTMSMTADEAFTVTHYAAHGGNIFSPEKFWPNNHVPNSLLVWTMFQIAPWQEWAMRLPAVLAGIGVLLTLRQLGRFLFGAGLCSVLLIAVVALHPLVFQFLSFARGYGASLLFSLLGFYVLLRMLGSTTENERHNMSVAGILFGLSVAANLTAAIMNASLIAGFLVTAVCSDRCADRFHAKQFGTFLLRFCLPGAGIALAPYAPMIVRISLARFDYASDSAWEGLLDPLAYALGRCDVVSEVNRLLVGVPVSEETYWLALALMPFVVVLPTILAGAAFAAGSLRTIKTRPLRPDESALLMILLGLFCYTAILCTAPLLGKPLFPKDRTGILPIVYASMLPVLLAYRFETSATLLRAGRVLTALLFLYVIHLTALFAYPYYHNIWYADADIRDMMQDVRKRIDEPFTPKTLVCMAMNEPAIEYYQKKYTLDDLHVVRILQVEDVANAPRDAFYILPAHEAEAVIRRESKSMEILRRNLYTDLILIECSCPD